MLEPLLLEPLLPLPLPPLPPLPCCFLEPAVWLICFPLVLFFLLSFLPPPPLPLLLPLLLP